MDALLTPFRLALWLPWAALTIVWVAFTRVWAAIVKLFTHMGELAAAERRRLPGKTKEGTEVKWAIQGFDALLKANEECRGTNRRATVWRESTGKRYVVELYEVREEPDGSITRIETSVDP
jgi:hypothetical protein